jgi:hypothetical protein
VISLSPIALAAALAFGASEAAVTPCRDVRHATHGFDLVLDWERASHPDPRAGSLFRTVSESDRTAEPDCVLTAAVDPSQGAILPARAVSERVLPESSGSSERGPAWLRPFSFFVSATGVYDSNINHDEQPVRDYGSIFGVGTRFETDAVEIEYELASHRYRNTNHWDRISHNLTSSYQQKFSRKFSIEAFGEIALKGSSEDRELGDQYIFEPRLHYRISPSSRLRLYAAYRLRRYDVNPQRDANNQFAGLELRKHLGRAIFDLGYRWEKNRAAGPRYTYDRQTYSAQFYTPFAGGLHRLGMELRYRPQQYSHRFVDNHAANGLRRDARWIYSLNSSFSLGRSLELLPEYRFERRSSNDPGKKFDAHVAYLGLRYWVGRGDNPSPRRRHPAQPPALAAKKEEPIKRDTASPSPGRSEAPPAPISRSEARAPLAAKKEEPMKKDTASPSPDQSEAPPAPISRSEARAPLPRPAATSSAASLVVSPAAAVQASNEKWSKRAEAERLRLVRGDAGRYAIELGLVCGARFLEDAWRNDSKEGAMWLIRSESSCYRVFWGHYSSQRDAERALRKIPEDFRSGSQRPLVVLLAAGSSPPAGKEPSR